MIDIDRWQEILFTLKQHKLRTALTAFGVFWGIFMLVILLGAGRSLAEGAQKGFAGRSNAIFVWNGGATQIPYKGLPTGRRINITDQDREALGRMPDIGYITSVNNLGGWQVDQYVVRKGKTGTFDTRGVEAEQFKIGSYNIVRGRLLNDNDFNERRKVVVIGDKVAELLFEADEETIGESVTVGGVNFIVIGVFNQADGDPSSGTRVYMPNSTLRTTFNQTGWIGHFELTPLAHINAVEFEQDVLALLRERHKVHPKDIGTFGSYNMQKQYDKVQGLFFGIQFISWFVAIVTIIAGVVGVGNIMLIVVKERTREIGLHKALGATSWNVIATILQETLVLTFVSGYFGLVAGVFLLEGVTSVLGSVGGAEMFANAEIDFKTAIIALTALVIAGVFAAIMPAAKAARVDPIIALQDE
ncbi:MAG: putative ABC transport system permease protein [Flavobacteriales bacterium]|jgi:putative ABC transport system permease protein